MKVRTRFALNILGSLSMGNARIALYNWIYAQRYKGKFYVRIDDIGVPAATSRRTCLTDLKWLGFKADAVIATQKIDHDHTCRVAGWQEIVIQSTRGDIYRNEAEQLIQEGKAYRCYCTTDEILKNVTPQAHYNGRCRRLTPEERAEYIRKGTPFSVRLNVQNIAGGTIQFLDLVHGLFQVDVAEVGDFIIMKPDSTGVYWPASDFASVVDDLDMDITHVIRSDDQLYSTFRQELICIALRGTFPTHSHIPHINTLPSVDFYATTMGDCRKMGFVPAAVINYLGRVGWETENHDPEICNPSQLIDNFDFASVHRKRTEHDENQLFWFQSKHMKRLPRPQLFRSVVRYLDAIGETFHIPQRTKLFRLLNAVADKIKTLSDILEYRYLFHDRYFVPEKGAIEKYLSDPSAVALLREFYEAAPEEVENYNLYWNTNKLSSLVERLSQRANKSPDTLLHALRVAVTGKMYGLGTYEAMEMIGGKICMSRILEVLEERENTLSFYYGT